MIKESRHTSAADSHTTDMFKKSNKTNTYHNKHKNIRIARSSWTVFVKAQNGHSLARLIKSVSFGCASRASGCAPIGTVCHGGSAGTGGDNLERSLDKKLNIDLYAEPFEITRWVRGSGALCRRRRLGIQWV
jgi:hypothetical protein